MIRALSLPAVALAGIAALSLDSTVDDPWRTDLDAATKEAVEKDRPLLVVFR